MLGPGLVDFSLRCQILIVKGGSKWICVLLALATAACRRMTGEWLGYRLLTQFVQYYFKSGSFLNIQSWMGLASLNLILI
jgi:hypothetical protein